MLVSGSGVCSPVFASDQPQQSFRSVGRQIPVRREGPQSMHAWYGCLREEIDRQWMTQKPHILAEYRCTCNIFLDGSGKLSDLKLLSTTGPTELDSSFLASIKQAFLVQPYLCELGRNRKFRMDFDESEQPKIHFKIIE